tara:strand:- start:174 stop:575 length:402 start_codon:yes stop_codon:yes gene_type:complete
MKDFVSKLLAGSLVEARELLENRLDELIEERLTEEKAKMALEMFDLDEGNIQKMGRMKLVRVRIRKGKVQRRRKVSGVKGFTLRGGKMIRMSPMERRNRRMAARRSKFKRRAKLGQALRKRKMSLRRRSSMGL